MKMLKCWHQKSYFLKEYFAPKEQDEQKYFSIKTYFVVSRFIITAMIICFFSPF